MQCCRSLHRSYRKQNDTVIKYNDTDNKTISMIKKNLYEFIYSIDSSVANLLCPQHLNVFNHDIENK